MKPDVVEPDAIDREAAQSGPVLITSFRPWRAHQASNSSDDLLAELYRQLPAEVIWLRQVPVNFQLAPIQVIGELYRLRPRLVICCGMAEHRACLSLEHSALRHTAQPPHRVRTTSINLPPLLAGTTLSEISHDAGNYVCNHLYYSVLEFIDQTNLGTKGLFIHIPILRPDNKKNIMADFLQIYSTLTAPR